MTKRECPVCHQEVPVVNHGVERGREVGYLARHSRPGIARTSKCRGSFGGWVGRRIGGGKGPENPEHRVHDDGLCWCQPTVVKVPGR